VNDLTIGLLSALLATNQPQAVSNLVQQQTGVSVQMVNPNDPAEKELLQLMADDDAALADVDKWIRDNDAFAAQGAGLSKAELNEKIRARFASVKKNYEDFLKRHPDSVRANYYGENGPITNAFIYYAKAVELNPNEPVYYQNFATMVYLYRPDARQFYGINEQQVFDKALALYRQAMKIAPDNFVLATDYAQSYYGIKPLRTNDALMAWTNALQIAHDDNEREGVLIHLARVKIAAGFYDEAQAHLDAVTNAAFADMRHRLERSLADHKNPPTNSIIISTNATIAPTNAP